MRQTDRQIRMYQSLTNKQFRAKYKVPKKLTKKERRKRNRARRKNERLAKGQVNNISQWRRAVLMRDDYTCQDCGRRQRRGIHAHHIKMKSEYPEIMLDLDNGITLCRDCHNKIHDDLLDYYSQQAHLRAIIH